MQHNNKCPRMDSTPFNSAKSVAGLTKSTLAIAISGALMTGMANAQQEDEGIELDKLKVEEELVPDTNPYAEPGSPYLGRVSGDPRRTRPILETPQTMTILTQEQLQDSGRSDLKEILDGQPGITLGTGENGNAFGDRYVIRGHEARSDMFVDGLRDPGMTTRESFAIEQLEISKGPSSTFAGRGTTGGAVNSISKRASTEYDFNKLSAGVGTDEYHRLTLDSNYVIDYDTALRINVLHAAEDVPDREPASRERTGLALSLTHQPTDNLEITGDIYHLEASDKPDLGTYLEDADGDGMTNDPVKDLPVYTQDEDFLDSTVDTATLRIGYEISPKSKIVNLTRIGTTENGYVVTGARGATGYNTEDDANNGVNGFDTISLSTHQGWQEVEYFANQLNFITDQVIGGKNHEFVYGFEISNSNVKNGTYETNSTGATNCWMPGRTRPGDPPAPAEAAYCGLIDGLVSNNLLQRDITKSDWDSDWSLKSASLSVMDTVDINDKWTVFGGLRYDHYDFELKTQGRSEGEYDYTDGDWNGHVGASYDLSQSANVYASYSTATNLNGGESDVGTSGGYGGYVEDDNASTEPEKTTSYEIGVKYGLNNSKLLASAAVFQIIKDDVMESDGRGYDAVGSANTGKNRVNGIELGISGNLTNDLSIQAGLALMEAEVLKSATDPDNVGKTLANFADESASIHLAYALSPKFKIGGGLTYESERYTGQPDTAANEEMSVPAYTLYDMFATYKIQRNLSVRVNVGNLTDEDYYLAAYRSGSFTYKGDGRNVLATLNYDF